MPALSVTAALSFIKDNLIFYSNPLLAVQALSISQSMEVDGKNVVHATQLIGTTDETLDKGDIGTIGYVYIKNLGTSLISEAPDPIITPRGTVSSHTWSYKIVAYQDSIIYSSSSGDGTTTIGNATLSGGNYNLIQWLPVEGAISYNVYRTASGGTPSTTGKIATVLPTTTITNFPNNDGITYIFLNDAGLAGDTLGVPGGNPFDYQVKLGGDGSTYPLLLKGQDEEVFRWNATDIHAKATTNPSNIEYLLIEA